MLTGNTPSGRNATSAYRVFLTSIKPSRRQGRSFAMNSDMNCRWKASEGRLTPRFP